MFLLDNNCDSDAVDIDCFWKEGMFHAHYRVDMGITNEVIVSGCVSKSIWFGRPQIGPDPNVVKSMFMDVFQGPRGRVGCAENTTWSCFGPRPNFTWELVIYHTMILLETNCDL